ncbi:uncharacterized protein [Amphiura filiformis]|uniref:uncharacterized protein n=1 Tax=Amphiura filiformis TaxID=82378 RepID=UPI003B20E1FA
MLWCVPRSVSTSFLKCMTNVPNSQMWYEPYIMTLECSNYGKYRKDMVNMMQDAWGAKETMTVATFGSGISGGYLAADKSYSWIKTELEKTPPDDKKIVFCKEMSRGIDGLYEYIPDGFRHTFLIRHPYRVFQSWDRMINRSIEDESKRMKISDLPEYLWPSGFFFKEQYDLYQHVKEHYESNPVIIDTDDLLADPGRILKAYCQAVGIPYTDDLLHWDTGREYMDKQWMVAKELIMSQNIRNPHAETFSSTCFGKPTKTPNREELSDDVRNYSDLCMEYYDDMYANRLKV